MKDIALAIMVVGLCFYVTIDQKNTGKVDQIASIIAFIAAVTLLLR